MALHTKHPAMLLRNFVYVFHNLFWKICPLFGQILISCLKCSEAFFWSSSYSEKMRWGLGCSCNVPLLSWQFWREKTVKIWLLSKFFVIAEFLLQSVTWRLHKPFFGISFFKTIQSMTRRGSFTNFKIIITKCYKQLLQSAKGITKC